MTTDLAMYTPEALQRSATAAEIRAQVNLIQEVMQAVMKDGVHYGKIPGTDKPTLYKAGSEKILSTFHIAVEPIVTDLSVPGEAARFRVEARATTQGSGSYLGSGVGEASSDEDKYKWRAAVCREEWDATPVDRRRTKWKKGAENKTYSVNQVRTEPADVANTILKMAKKRAQIDMTLTVTAASDVFAQDIEDLPEEIREEVAQADAPRPAAQAPQRREAAPSGTTTAAPAAGGAVISEPQAKRFYAIAMQAGWTADDLKAWLKTNYGIDSDRDIPRSRYDEIVKAVQQAGG